MFLSLQPQMNLSNHTVGCRCACYKSQPLKPLLCLQVQRDTWGFPAIADSIRGDLLPAPAAWLLWEPFPASSGETVLAATTHSPNHTLLLISFTGFSSLHQLFLPHGLQEQYCRTSIQWLWGAKCRRSLQALSFDFPFFFISSPPSLSTYRSRILPLDFVILNGAE